MHVYYVFCCEHYENSVVVMTCMLMDADNIKLTKMFNFETHLFYCKTMQRVTNLDNKCFDF